MKSVKNCSTCAWLIVGQKNELSCPKVSGCEYIVSENSLGELLPKDVIKELKEVSYDR
jgi:hypothetical protein